MTMENMVKRLQNIIRQDSGIDGSAQLISQLVWMIFLKLYDAKLMYWEEEADFESKLPEHLNWSEWALDEDASGVKGKGITGDELITFINTELLPTIKEIKVGENSDKRDVLLNAVFVDSYNYMKDGTLLRMVINVLNEVDFTNQEETHAFNDVYESLLKGLQASGTHGEFYTPRALTDFVVEMTKPQLGEKVADFACGTGGMLISALEELDKQVDTVEKKTVLQNSIYGQELKPLPYLLATTNLMFHDIEVPNILRGNSLASDVRYPEQKMDVLVMNPPYGASSSADNKLSVPLDMQGSELSDLFIVKMMYALNEGGRVGVILPDGFLFGTDNAKVNIKKKLLNEFNLHTIIRLPAGVFAPYTSITTNILFFDKTTPTEDVWYYEHKVGNGGKTYTKTKQIRSQHFEPERAWWENREENDSAFKVSKEDIIKNNYNLDFKRSQVVEEVRRDVHEIIGSMTASLMKQMKALDELRGLI